MQKCCEGNNSLLSNQNKDPFNQKVEWVKKNNISENERNQMVLKVVIALETPLFLIFLQTLSL